MKTFHIPTPISRRRFLRGLGVTVGIPMLECMTPVFGCVAYVEPMSVPLTWSAVAFTVAKFVVAENVLAPDIVWTPDSLTESPTPYTSQFDPSEIMR